MNTKVLHFVVFALSCLAIPLSAAEPAGRHVWEALNAKLHVTETGLKVLSIIDQPRPVLKISDVVKNGPFTVKVRIKVTNSGSVGVVWYQTNEKDTHRRKSLYKKLKPKAGHQEVTLKVPVDGRATDFEIRVPWGDCSIQSIHFSGGGEDLHWDFGEDPS